jgi:hypothetical protein
MAYVRKKRVGGREYYQLVEGYRENGKVRQRVLAHLGKRETPEAAITYWQREAEWSREYARDLLHAAEYIREGRAAPNRYGARRKKRLVPRYGTPLDSDAPAAGRRAPKGWFFSDGMADDVEREAGEHLAQAEKFEGRIARLRSVL